MFGFKASAPMQGNTAQAGGGGPASQRPTAHAQENSTAPLPGACARGPRSAAAAAAATAKPPTRVGTLPRRPGDRLPK
jgi:hypothetical protein